MNLASIPDSNFCVYWLLFLKAVLSMFKGQIDFSSISLKTFGMFGRVVIGAIFLCVLIIKNLGLSLI